MITDEAKRVKAEAYAKSVREVVERKHIMEARIRKQREELEVSAVTIDEKVIMSPSMDAIPNGVAAIADMVSAYTADLNQYVRVVDEFERAISHLWPSYEYILELRYVQCRQWAEIAQIACYNERYVFEAHRLALIGLYDLMPAEWRRK